MKHLIALVGMPGSGKSEAGNFFKESSIPVLRFGDLTEEALKEKHLPITEENERTVRENLRKEFGMAAFAIKMQPKIETALESANIVVLDGMYSWEEYVYLKERFPFLQVLCIYASPELRYERLLKRPERSLMHHDAVSRDYAEITNLNKGGPIAMADYLIKNEGTEEELRNELERFLKTRI